MDSGSRTTIQQNTIIDNDDNGIQVLSNYAVIKLNTIDGDTSEMAVLLNTARSASVTNNTIEGGSQGIKVQNSTNVFIYNNTVKSNSGYGIYLLLGSH